MTFPAPSRCPRARRRATRAYPSSSPPPRRFSSSPSTSPPRDRPTVSAPHFLLPSSHRPKSPITQEDSPPFPSLPPSHLRRKLISSINSHDHHRVASPPPLFPLSSPALHIRQRHLGRFMQTQDGSPTTRPGSLTPSVPRCLKRGRPPRTPPAFPV